MKHALKAILIIGLVFANAGCVDEALEAKQCDEIDRRFPSPSFYYGFSTWPYGPSNAARKDVYRVLKKSGTIYSEQLQDEIPWEDLYYDRDIPEYFQEKVGFRLERRSTDQKLLLYVTPLNMGHTDIAVNQHGKVPFYETMDQEHLVYGYARYVLWLVGEFKPDYLVMGIEVNELFEKDKKKWKEFKSLMTKVREHVKKLYPGLPVSESMSLHNIMFPDNENVAEYQREMKKYIERLDFATFSFYPFMKGLSTKKQFDQAFDFVKAFTNKPIAFTETAHIAEDLIVKGYNLHLPSNVCQQKLYLEALLEHAEKDDYEFIIWWSFRDYDRLWKTFPAEVKDLGQLWRDTGMIDENGVERPAWRLWKTMAEEK